MEGRHGEYNDWCGDIYDASNKSSNQLGIPKDPVIPLELCVVSIFLRTFDFILRVFSQNAFVIALSIAALK